MEMEMKEHELIDVRGYKTASINFFSYFFFLFFFKLEEKEKQRMKLLWPVSIK